MCANHINHIDILDLSNYLARVENFKTNSKFLPE